MHISGLNAIVLMLLAKKLFCRPSWISCHWKDWSTLKQVVVRQIWNQNMLFDRKQQKNIIMSKNKVVWPLARTKTHIT